MKIAVIGGTGQQGYGLALRWAKAGESVIVGSRQLEKAEKAAKEMNQILGSPLVVGMSNPDAAREAEMIVLTVPHAAHLSTLQSIKEVCSGKIVVDVTVPLHPEDAKRVKLPEAGSAAEEAQRLLGPETLVVGAFHNVSAHSLRELGHEIHCDVLVCGDHRDAKRGVIELAQKINCRAYDAGPLESARTIEGITAIIIRLNIRHKRKDIGIRFTGI